MARAKAPTIWAQTGTGIAFDLINPRPEMVNFKEDIAEGLARLPRFCGQVRSGPYSVAQHFVTGADQMFRETHRADLAAAFLLHDAHEAYINDIPTPVVAALAALANAEFEKPGYDAGYIVKSALKSLKHIVDRAIYGAAGIAFPLPEATRAAVKRMDLRMLATERRHLLGPAPHAWAKEVETAEVIPLRGGLTVMPWPDAADAYIAALGRYVPGIQTRRVA